MSDSPAKLSKRSELAETLWRFRGAFVGVAAFSALINLLMLTGPLFMLQVYDRVLPSRSVPTLVALMLLMAALYAFQATLEGTRARLLVRLGYYLDEAMSQRLYNAVVRLPLRLKSRGDGSEHLQDIDHIRGFFSSGGPIRIRRFALGARLSRRLFSVPPVDRRRRANRRRGSRAHNHLRGVVHPRSK